MNFGLSARIVATAALAVALCGALGILAGALGGVMAGVSSALAGLAPAALLTAALEQRARNLERRRRIAEVRILLAAPEKPLITGSKEVSLRGAAWLLRPETKLVTFWPRPELADLVSWCDSDQLTAVRLLTGPGGSGKTRLALRLGEVMAASDWAAGWVPRGYESSAVEFAAEIGQRTILVLDYAETRAEIGELLEKASHRRSGPRMRVLLIARSAGEWWQQVVADSDEETAAMLSADRAVDLGPLTSDDNQQQVFEEALTAFSDVIGIARPPVDLTIDEPGAVVLAVHAAALLVVLDSAVASTEEAPRSGAEALAGVLRHEARYWTRSAAASRIGISQSLQRLVIALGCLIGADDEVSATGLLSSIPDLSDSAQQRGLTARWLHDLYPADTTLLAQAGREWIGALRPDLVAEQLIVNELTERPALASDLFVGLKESRVTRALTILARAAITDIRAKALIQGMIAADVENLAILGLSISAETNPSLVSMIGDLIKSSKISRRALERIADALPFSPSAGVGAAVVVLRRLVQDSGSAVDEARWLCELGRGLSVLGQYEDALSSAERAGDLYRALVVADPEAFCGTLASSLILKSDCLAALMRHEEALAAIEEAADLYRGLAQGSPAAFRPELARALNNCAIRLAALGRRHEALAAADEAVELCHFLAHVDPQGFNADLAKSLNNKSNCLAMLGRPTEALSASEQAVTIYRQIAEDNNNEFLSYLAGALNNHSNWAAAIGRRSEALSSIREAIEIRRRLATRMSDVFLPDLAGSLNNGSVRLRQAGLKKEALAMIEESVVIRRELARRLPDAYLPDLAASLAKKSACLEALRQHAEAQVAEEEAAELYQVIIQKTLLARSEDRSSKLNVTSRTDYNATRQLIVQMQYEYLRLKSLG